MQYSAFVELYEALAATSKRLEKTEILAKFLKMLEKQGNPEWIYFLRGRVLPDYDSREFGISTQLVIKSLSAGWGISNEILIGHYRKLGDLGDIAQKLAGKKKQSTLFSQKLSMKKVYDTLQKLFSFQGKGSVDRKIACIAELLASATPLEAKYIVRTLLSDLRIGVAEAILVDALAKAFYPGEQMSEAIHDAYYIANDFAEVFSAAVKGKKSLQSISIVPGKPLNVMLPVKVNELSEAFEICGKPAALEHKYDGFRMLIHKQDKQVTLFTRKLENVTKQFHDVVSAVNKYIVGKNFIIDSEVVGYDPATKKYKPFEAVSQRIKRKHDIDKLVHALPVEVNVFDILYYNGKSVMHMIFSGRRKLVEKIVKTEKMVIRPSFQIITDDEKKAEEFYNHALKMGEEGIMIKKLDAPYRPGRRVGYLVKLKPIVNDIDLVIVGAEYGSGKRAGFLTSYILACKDGEKFVELGMASSGLKEKAEEGTTYEEMTRLLRPLIVKEEGTSVKVKPKLIVSVTYQNIQKSPGYSSGFAMRFPRIMAYRPDRGANDIATLVEIKKAMKKEQ